MYISSHCINELSMYLATTSLGCNITTFEAKYAQKNITYPCDKKIHSPVHSVTLGEAHEMLIKTAVVRPTKPYLDRIETGTIHVHDWSYIQWNPTPYRHP